MTSIDIINQKFNELETTDNKIISEIYVSGEFNNGLNYTSINNYISKIGVEYASFLMKNLNGILQNTINETDIDELSNLGETRNTQRCYTWIFIHNDVYIDVSWRDEGIFSCGDMVLKYHENIDKNKLEICRRNLINWFCCPTYDAKNYDEYIKKYEIEYYTPKI